jgi:conjugative transfer signal peptidase TraF
MSRASILPAGMLGLALLAGSAVATPRPLLAWNATASAPIGFYRVQPAGTLYIGELVLARPPAPLAVLFARRGYLPLGVPLLKHVAALAGDRVCRTGLRITIDGRFVALALARDHLGRPLPGWSGCRRLADGEVFLLNADVPVSLDGRYFGPLSITAIVGRATPLWILGARP